MAAEPFLWGQGGTKLTPDQIEAQRKIAAALMRQGMDFSPVGHWSQGLARVAQGVMGAIDDRVATGAEKDNSAYNDSIINTLLGGAATSVPAAAAMPTTTGAGNEMAATSPAVVAANTPVFANDGTELGAYLSDDARRATLPAGMRNNNPGNIKYVGQRVPGIVGPSVNTDQGDPQAVFDTPESGMRAMYSLLGKKYAGGKLTPNQMIAGDMGWTPGNFQAAANVARTMGIRPDEDIGFNDPQRAAKFMQALILQEHGQKGRLYPESLVLSAIGGQPTQVASASPQAAMAALSSSSMPPAAAAIEAAAPASGYVDPMVSAQPDAPALPAPTTIASPPAVAAVPPQQVAQALTGPQPQRQAPGINPAIIRALTDPRASPQTQAVAKALLQQQIAQQQAQQEMQLKQADPAYQLGLRKSQLEIDALQNPNAKVPDSVRSLQLRAEQAGLQPGTPDYQKFMLSGGDKGITINNEGSIPAGYQALRDDQGRITSIQPIPGSPAALEMEQALKARETQGGRKETATDVITNAASEARNLLKNGTMTTGTLGRMAANLTESDAAELRRQIGVLTSNATIENLTAMRQASPTGGALGSVTEKEGAMLAAAAGAIDPNAGREQVEKALDNYEKTLLRVIHGPKVGDAIFEQTRQLKSGPEDVPQGVDPEDWKYMTPEQRRLFQ